jgi:hypothetical protein
MISHPIVYGVGHAGKRAAASTSVVEIVSACGGTLSQPGLNLMASNCRDNRKATLALRDPIDEHIIGVIGVIFFLLLFWNLDKYPCNRNVTDNCEPLWAASGNKLKKQVI